MKKKLESELISIAHRILKLKGKEDVEKMHAEVSSLYEKLTVLKFANDNFEDQIPTIGNDSSFFGMLDTAFNNTVSDAIEYDNKVYTNIETNDDEAISEPLMETIKDMVAQMPDETHQVDDLIESINPTQYTKNDFEDLTADFKETPIFEPVENQASSAKKTLNDAIKTGNITIGLNDKLAFIKHLFNGKNEDYDRVISQLNTISTFKEASKFINELVKPDYNNWNGKEEFETRFIEIIEASRS